MDAQSTLAVTDPAIHKAVLEVLKLIGDPFLIVSVIVVFLMYRLLQRKEKTFDNSLKEIYNELHANALLITEQAAVIRTLVEMMKRDDQKIRREEREASN